MLNKKNTSNSFSDLFNYLKPWKSRVYLASIYSATNKIFDVPSDPKFIDVCEAKRKALRKYQQLFDTSKIWFASLAVPSLSRYPKRNEAMFGFHSEGLCPRWI